MIQKIHFDTELDIKLPVPRKIRGLVGVSYKGENKYEIKAMNTKTREIVFNKVVEFTTLKGNSRKNFSKIRDMALNAVESRPLNYARNEG